ncbi:hypothetical protein [Segatella oris]|nr:hypothetical protein [Segatella oris]
MDSSLHRLQFNEWYEHYNGDSTELSDALATTYGGLLGIILLLYSL